MFDQSFLFPCAGGQADHIEACANGEIQTHADIDDGGAEIICGGIGKNDTDGQGDKGDNGRDGYTPVSPRSPLSPFMRPKLNSAI